MICNSEEENTFPCDFTFIEMTFWSLSHKTNIFLIRNLGQEATIRRVHIKEKIRFTFPIHNIFDISIIITFTILPKVRRESSISIAFSVRKVVVFLATRLTFKRHPAKIRTKEALVLTHRSKCGGGVVSTRERVDL